MFFYLNLSRSSLLCLILTTTTKSHQTHKLKINISSQNNSSCIFIMTFRNHWDEKMCVKIIYFSVRIIVQLKILIYYEYDHCQWAFLFLTSWRAMLKYFLLKQLLHMHLMVFVYKIFTHHYQSGQHFNFSKFPDFSLTFPENFLWFWSSRATLKYNNRHSH